MLPPPRLVSPRGAMRRSLVAWGWGQIATGDRRGWLLLALELVALVALAVVAAPYARGTTSGLVFVAGATFVVVWAAQAVQAARRAASRLAPYAAGNRAPAAIELLWLAPVVVVGATVFWTLAGPATSADDLLADYVDLWQAGRASEAVPLFASPPDASVLAATWDRQDARLRNETIRAAAEAGPDGGIDPDDPWGSVRWERLGQPASDGLPTDGGEAVAAATIVREESVRDAFLGLVPTRTVRVVPVSELGSVRLRTVALPGPFPGAPPVVEWRIESVDLLSERVGG